MLMGPKWNRSWTASERKRFKELELAADEILRVDDVRGRGTKSWPACFGLEAYPTIAEGIVNRRKK